MEVGDTGGVWALQYAQKDSDAHLSLPTSTFALSDMMDEGTYFTVGPGQFSTAPLGMMQFSVTVGRCLEAFLEQCMIPEATVKATIVSPEAPKRIIGRFHREFEAHEK